VGTGLFGCLYCLLTAEKIVYNALNNCVVSVAPSSNKLCMFNVCTGRLIAVFSVGNALSLLFL
jgi:hypothetical protein